MDFTTLPYALIFSITGIAVEVLMVANDRGTECCCCWIVVNLWVVVSRCGWLCVVVAGFGSLWVVPIDILYTLDSASNYSAVQKLKP
jgi:hypothetical protein